MSFLAVFFAGVFLCNSIPHLSSGLRGVPFPTPFAKPRGVGDSPPVINFVWGAFNMFVGAILYSLHPFVAGLNAEFLVFFVGALLIGLVLAVHFGKVQSQKRAATNFGR